MFGKLIEALVVYRLLAAPLAQAVKSAPKGFASTRLPWHPEWERVPHPERLEPQPLATASSLAPAIRSGQVAHDPSASLAALAPGARNSARSQ